MADRLVIDKPVPGYYKCKLVKGGAFVSGRIWREAAVSPEGDSMEGDRPEVMLAEINGKSVPALEAWVRLAAHPITRQEFDYIRGVKGWADQHAPDAPEANPKKAVDFTKLKFDF